MSEQFQRLSNYSQTTKKFENLYVKNYLGIITPSDRTWVQNQLMKHLPLISKNEKFVDVWPMKILVKKKKRKRKTQYHLPAT